MIVASPMGIMTPVTGNLERSDAPTMMGMSSTTIGVLFMKALSIAPATSVETIARTGLDDQALPTTLASGCSAPVVSSALPTIMSAQMAMSASLPKPAKKSMGPTATSPSFVYGNSVNPAVRIISIVSDDDSSGMRSRVNRNNATTVRTSTAMPCASGVMGCKASPCCSAK